MTISSNAIPIRPALDWPSRISATALLAATGLTLIDLLTGHHGIALVATALILLHVLPKLRQVRLTGRLMLVAAITMSSIFLVSGGAWADIALAASRALYLPALLAVMTLLRVATQRSRVVATAAHFVIDQPPSRRFLFLATGGHIFGILLNIGGLQLLMGLALAERDKAARSPEIAEIQGRRITNAVLRGFGATLLWSPVGVAINILIPLMPNLDWLEYAPYGLGLVVLFVGLGWVFDRFEPRAKRAFVAGRHEGAGIALCAIFALLAAITGSAAMAEAVFGLPIRAAILIVIPLMAIAWTFLTDPRRPAANIGLLARESFCALPRTVNEVCLIGSTSLLGLVVAQMIPPEAVRGLVGALNLGPGPLGCVIVLVMTLLSLIGLSPMISGTVSAGAILSANIAMSEPMLMVATLCGWAGAMMLSPATASVVIAAGASRKSTAQVGLGWNGKFTATFLGLAMIILLVWDRLS